MNEKYMKLAIKEARKAFKKGEIPVGAVIVKNNQIISQAHNEKENKKIATKHAELIAIEKACKKIGNWHLDECVLYTTLEPCIMCLGAIVQARIKKIIYATNSEKFGFSNIIHTEKIYNHYLEKESGICENEAKELMIRFFETKR